ncbi:hypothetical protein [Brevibacillus porteri]|uniref:hypothetical protein n=1 Tax=Brevibacillus porteri TaxID=2126350 RepID=UPI00363989F0
MTKEECKQQYCNYIDLLTDEEFQRYISDNDEYPDFFYGLYSNVDNLAALLVKEVESHKRPLQIILYPNNIHGELEFAIDIWHRYESK